MTKKEKENIKQVMKCIDALRKYKTPGKDSITADSFLRNIEENINSANKLIIDDEYLLATLTQFDYIQKKKKGEGYVPQEEYIENGLFEVRECFIITSNIKKSYTLLFTTKGQEFFKNVVLQLINLKQPRKTPILSE